MGERDDIHQPDRSAREEGGRATDHRRSAVNPNDKPVPSSPEAEHENVRAGEEQLERVKPY